MPGLTIIDIKKKKKPEDEMDLDDMFSGPSMRSAEEDSEEESEEDDYATSKKYLAEDIISSLESGDADSLAKALSSFVKACK